MIPKNATNYSCPECKIDLIEVTSKMTEFRIESGSYSCVSCNHSYLIKNSIPRFANQIESIKAKTAKSFGFKWKRFNKIDKSYKLNFLDELAPLDYQKFFKNKLVLDAGTGMGIPACCMGEWGAEKVYGADISSEIEVAYENTKHLSNVSIAQADIYKLPFKYNHFDVVVCVAVLQHLPDPKMAYRELLKYVKPGGDLIIWVYGREGNAFVHYFVEPFRKYIGTKIPLKILLGISCFLGGIFQIVSLIIYKPLEKLGLRFLPMHFYIFYRSQFGLKMNIQMVFDQLLAPLSYLFTRKEVEDLVVNPNIEKSFIRHHNKNSWTVFATKKFDYVKDTKTFLNEHQASV